MYGGRFLLEGIAFIKIILANVFCIKTYNCLDYNTFTLRDSQLVSNACIHYSILTRSCSCKNMTCALFQCLL